MNSVPDIYRILPEVILTLTGVAVMFIDASLLRHGRAVRLAGWLRLERHWLSGPASGSSLCPREPASTPRSRPAPSPFSSTCLSAASCWWRCSFARHSSRGQPSPRRVLCARSLWRCGHVPAHRRGRATGRLHCSRDLVHLHLHSGPPQEHCTRT